MSSLAPNLFSLSLCLGCQRTGGTVPKKKKKKKNRLPGIDDEETGPGNGPYSEARVVTARSNMRINNGVVSLADVVLPGQDTGTSAAMFLRGFVRNGQSMTVLKPARVALNGVSEKCSNAAQLVAGKHLPSQPAFSVAMQPRQHPALPSRPMLSVTGSRNMSAGGVRCLVARDTSRKWLPPLQTVFLAGQETVLADRKAMHKLTKLEHRKKTPPKPEPETPRPTRSGKKLWGKAKTKVEVVVQERIAARRAAEQNFFASVTGALSTERKRKEIEQAEKDHQAMMQAIEEEEVSCLSRL